MLCHFHFSKSSFPQWFSKNIMSKFLAFCVRVKLLFGRQLFSLWSLNLVSSLLISICIYADSNVFTDRDHILKLQYWSCFFGCQYAWLPYMSGRGLFAIRSIFFYPRNLNVLCLNVIIRCRWNPWHAFLLIESLLLVGRACFPFVVFSCW